MKKVYSRNSDICWAELELAVPVDVIEKEYVNIKDSLILHRPHDGHKDWFAVTLYGISSEHTNSHWEYSNSKKTVTDIGQLCPQTLDWVFNLPFSRIDDVRFLVIKANGFISEHIDVLDQNWLDPLNISITYPKGNIFVMEDAIVPYDVGKSFVLNIHYKHSVTNNSNYDRLHLLVHGKKRKDFWEAVVTVHEHDSNK
jgi:hypothetical protein